MNSRISRASWHGQDAFVQENDTMRIVTVPDLGAKLVSLFDKRSGREWLVGPGERAPAKVPYGASFVDQDMSGWDEMFPTIVACAYPVPGAWEEAQLPDHGEVWPLSWELQPSSADTLRLSVEGKALPYRLTRTLSFASANILEMTYELQNLGDESMPYLWSAHPQFICGDEAEIRLPARVTEVCNTIPAEWGWGAPETRFDWPEALSVDGQRVRIDRTGPASLKRARKFFVEPETAVRWAGLVRRPAGDWLRLDWDPTLVPYFGMWVDEGAISHETVVALEPMTGYYDSLAVAWQKGRVATIEPGEVKSWTLQVRLGTADDGFPTDN
jgi:galactose mutarotase-like enzyme